MKAHNLQPLAVVFLKTRKGTQPWLKISESCSPQRVFQGGLAVPSRQPFSAGGPAFLRGGRHCDAKTSSGLSACPWTPLSLSSPVLRLPRLLRATQEVWRGLRQISARSSGSALRTAEAGQAPRYSVVGCGAEKQRASFLPRFQWETKKRRWRLCKLGPG